MEHQPEEQSSEDSRLAAETWIAVRPEIEREAHRNRVRVLRTGFLALEHAVTATIRRLADWQRRIATRRQDRDAIAQLRKLDEVALKDIGLRRSEIESVIRSHGEDETRKRRPTDLAA
jgi:uncharacterized protein YjiS (DUF1127 family)